MGRLVQVKWEIRDARGLELERLARGPGSELEEIFGLWRPRTHEFRPSCGPSLLNQRQKAEFDGFWRLLLARLSVGGPESFALQLTTPESMVIRDGVANWFSTV